MSTWSPSELDALDRVSEIRVAGRRTDGTLRTPRIVWQVVVEGELYIRSVYGTEGKWYQGVAERLEGEITWGGTSREVSFVLDPTHDEAIDAAYFSKYGTGSPSQSITSAVARTTTLRVDAR